MRNQSIRIIAHAIAIIALLAVCLVTAQAQNARHADNQYGISFQPPAGWKAEPIAQYVGPARQDGGFPMLTLVAEDKARDLSDNGMRALEKEIADEFSVEGLEAVLIADRRKKTIAGRDALQIDVTYRLGGISARQRRVYLPASEHNRTYLFTFVDAAQHFDQTSAVADAAINSFTYPAPPGAQTSGEAQTSGQTIPLALLIILGVVALVVIIGSGYLLLQRRASA